RILRPVLWTHLRRAPIGAVAVRDRVGRPALAPSEIRQRRVSLGPRQHRIIKNAPLRRQASRVEPAQEHRARSARAIAHLNESIAKLGIECSVRLTWRSARAAP